MDILVTPTHGHRGTLEFGDATYACALGRAGGRADKREGEGATPAGRFALREIRYRAGRLTLPDTELPATPIEPTDELMNQPSLTGIQLLPASVVFHNPPPTAPK